jgi:phospholipid-binding lipoprotein MlaA
MMDCQQTPPNDIWMQKSIRAMVRLVLLVCAIVMLGGCASNGSKIDPWENMNRAFYQFDDGLDKVIFKPVSDAYVKYVPQQVRTCVSNTFDNAHYANVILNDFLQGKWEQGWSDAGRMGVNSTLGIAGIFDVATPMGMAAHDNDFGITLGRWGCPPGPYLCLPLFGPSSARDVWSIPVQILTSPTTWIGMPGVATVSIGVAEAVDERSRYDSMVKFRDAAAIDPYVFTREGYLAYRENQVNEGKPAKTPKENIYDEDFGEPATRPAAKPAGATAPTTAPATQLP